MTIPRSYIVAALALVVLSFSAYILLYKLGNEPFQDYDEATYALVTKASREAGNPPGLAFLNQPYFRKPPLLFWMTTASASVFPDAEFADRLPSALAGMAAIALVALICVEAGAGVGIGLLAAMILATTAGWMEFARDVRFDTLVAFFDVAALYAALRANRDSRWFMMVGILLALAVLSKSVVMLFGAVAVFVVLASERKLLLAFRDRNFWYGVGTFALVALPWHLYMTLVYGGAFWHSYLGTEVLERAGTNLFPGGGNPTNGQYLSYLVGVAAPWTELFLLAVACAPLYFKRLRPPMRSAFLASLAAVAFVILVSFLAGTKAYGYLMPLFPFLAVALALASWGLWTRVAVLPRASDLKPVLVGLAIVLVASAATLTRYEALHINPYYSWEISQAYEERAVALIIRNAPSPRVYAYGGYDFLGTIYYYTGLADTENPVILTWSASSTPSSTGTTFVLTTASMHNLSSAFPEYSFTQDYAGRFVSLFTVAP